MKHLIFSDVHSNLEAMEALISLIPDEKPDRVLFLGDAVGYGANPSECLLAIAESSDLCLAGNHDAAVAGLLPLDNFNPLAQQAVFWTQSQLSIEEKIYLKNLPVILEFPEFCMVHSSPCAPHMWHYILTEEDALQNFPCFSSQICFIGHSHCAGAMILDQTGHCYPDQSEAVNIQQNYKYIINVGSVGQPRDNSPKAACCLYDDQKQYIQILRFDYNIQKAQEKIMKAGLPSFLATRLSFGI